MSELCIDFWCDGLSHGEDCYHESIFEDSLHGFGSCKPLNTIENVEGEEESNLGESFEEFTDSDMLELRNTKMRWVQIRRELWEQYKAEEEYFWKISDLAMVGCSKNGIHLVKDAQPHPGNWTGDFETLKNVHLQKDKVANLIHKVHNYVDIKKLN